jgi:hypothetical protein
MRFCNHSKAIHELTVKQVFGCLNEMKDEGLIGYPTQNSTLDMLVDSNFSGMWHKISVIMYCHAQAV